MSLAQKIRDILKDELGQEDINTVICFAEFLKFKETQKRWNQIAETPAEYLTKEERLHIEELKAKGQFVDQATLLAELGIDEDEL